MILPAYNLASGRYCSGEATWRRCSQSAPCILHAVHQGLCFAFAVRGQALGFVGLGENGTDCAARCVGQAMLTQVVQAVHDLLQVGLPGLCGFCNHQIVLRPGL